MYCMCSYVILVCVVGYDGDVNGIEFCFLGKFWIVVI